MSSSYYSSASSSSEQADYPQDHGYNLHKEEIDILQADLEEWKCADRNKRSTLLADLRTKVKNLESNQTLKTHEWVRKRKVSQSIYPQ
jgi:hypothetical protein